MNALSRPWIDHALENHILKTIDRGHNRGLLNFKHLEMQFRVKSSKIMQCKLGAAGPNF